MDPVTHSLAGLAVAGFSGQDFSLANPIYLGALLGSLAPDLDIVLQLKGHLTYLKHHRGPSHSLVGLAVLAGIIALGLAQVFPGYPWPVLFLWTGAGALSHTMLDVLNSHGARLLWPFSTRNYTANLLTLLDPVLLVVLAALFLGQVRESSLYTYSSLMVLAVYLSGRWLMAGRVRGFLAREFRHGEPGRIVTFPAVMSLWNWSFLVETPAAYLVGEVRCLSLALRVWHRLVKPGRNPLIKQALESKLGRLFTEFTPHPYVYCSQEEDRAVVRFLDLRYYVREDFLHSATLVFDQEQVPLEGLFHPYSRERRIKVVV